MNNDFEFYINVRQIFKNLGLNTGTSASPEFTTLCTLSEITCSIDWEQKDWNVACDAIKRALLTGVGVTFKTTVVIDMNNKAVKMPLKGLHTILGQGEIQQFNNQVIQIEVLDDITDGILTYKKYQLPAILKFSELGGAVEDEGKYTLEIIVNGKGKEITE